MTRPGRARAAALPPRRWLGIVHVTLVIVALVFAGWLAWSVIFDVLLDPFDDDQGAMALTAFAIGILPALLLATRSFREARRNLRP